MVLITRRNMPCYHPLFATKQPWESKNFEGDPKQYGTWKPDGTKDRSVHIYGSVKPEHWGTNPYSDCEIMIPCGKCIGCRLEYSRQWANRIILEAQDWSDNYFITLTYADEHLPTWNTVNRDTGELMTVKTLQPKHTQQFMKNLRNYYKYNYGHDNIRFYACGEYGELTQRPHYHLIIFNLPIIDLIPAERNEGGQLYTSEIIEKIWKKGRIRIAEVNWHTAAYTARYMTKKWKGPSTEEHYEKKGTIPEFARMSLKPGIAYKYYDVNHNKFYVDDEIIITGANNKSQAIKPMKYYDRLFDMENPEEMKKIKEKRKEIGETIQKEKLSRTNKNEYEYREIEERQKINQTMKLIRPLE